MPRKTDWAISLTHKKTLTGDQMVIYFSDAQAPQVQMSPWSLLMSSSLSWAFCCWAQMPRQVWQYICIYGGYICKSFIVPVSSCSSWLGRAQQVALCGEFISPIGNFKTVTCTFKIKKRKKNTLTYQLLIFTLVPQLFFTLLHPFELNRQKPIMPWFGGHPRSNPAVVALPLPAVLRLCSFSQAGAFIQEQVERQWCREREVRGTAWNGKWLLTFTWMQRGKQKKGRVGKKGSKKEYRNPKATARNGGECVMVTKATACCPVGCERWKGVLGGRSDGTSS